MRDEIKPLKKGAEMESLLRSAKERKKSRRLGEVEVMEREEYAELAVHSKVEIIRALVPLGLMHVQELLDDEMRSLACERCAGKAETVRKHVRLCKRRSGHVTNTNDLIACNSIPM